MIRGSPDPFPIFEGGVRLRQTRLRCSRHCETKQLSLGENLHVKRQHKTCIVHFLATADIRRLANS